VIPFFNARAIARPVADFRCLTGGLAG